MTRAAVLRGVQQVRRIGGVRHPSLPAFLLACVVLATPLAGTEPGFRPSLVSIAGELDSRARRRMPDGAGGPDSRASRTETCGV